MSVPANPPAARQALAQASEEVGPSASVPDLGMSPRQLQLNHRWRYYRCENYAGRKTAWDGSTYLDAAEVDAVVHSQAIPPGFEDVGGSMTSLRFRRPTAPYYLGRIIVDRFTGLLFSHKRHPKVTVDGDDQTEDFLSASIEVGRLWAQMIQARSFGGAMGSVAIGFQVVNGKPVFEVHDPRWCTPVFRDRLSLELDALEIRYMFSDDVRDPETGRWVEAWFWYRRVIDERYDVVWPRVPVGEGEEPDWKSWRHTTAEHGLGECPAEWIQNLPVQDQVDGDPDCHGCFDMIETIDALVAQANRGILSNCDPTLVLSSDADLDALSKGSGNAIKLNKGESAQYLEIDGAGPRAALDLAEKLEVRVCKQARAVLEQKSGQGQDKTATEVTQDYSSMWEKADVLREQYGERGIKRLLEKYIRAVRTITTRKTPDPTTGKVYRESIDLPPRPLQDPDTGLVKYVERTLGPGGTVSLSWADYREPSISDVATAVRAAVDALNGGIVDDEHAAKFVAQYFRVEDVVAMLTKLRAAKKDQADAMAAQMMGLMPPQ
jgi:hypothetical protein